MRLRWILLVALLAAAPVAGEVAANAPRFEVTPGATGVTRVDTATGAISHCTESGGVWFCERVETPAPGGLSDPGDLKAVSGALDALSSKVDELARRLDQVAPVASNAGRTGPRPLSAEVVARFVEMIRRLKHPRTG